ncbi:MAG: methyltransferase domain-containing protein [Thermoanaerobaculia bacterium]
MTLLVPPRRPSREALDDGNLPCEEMCRSLHDLALVNRHWGGSRALERYLLPRLREAGPGSVRLLDVGAGSGDVSRRLARVLRESGFDASVVAVDLQWRHLAAGRRMFPHEPLPCTAADAFRLPFASRSIDWIVSTLLFHHFSPEQNVRFLRELARVARRGFALLDLRRHLFPLLFVRLAGALVFESPVSIQDGVASVGQAYTLAEARAILRQAVPGFRVEKVFPFRLLITSPDTAFPTLDSRLSTLDSRP